MIEALEFMEKYERRIVDFTETFDKLIYAGIQRLKGRYPSDALEYLLESHKRLLDMKDVYNKQKGIEKYLLKLNKKIIHDVKEEKKGHQ